MTDTDAPVDVGGEATEHRDVGVELQLLPVLEVETKEVPGKFWTIRYKLEDASGAVVEVTGELAGQTFPSQADAESWVGETWSELAEQGVDAVTLLEADRVVYGPMSLHP